MSPRGGNHNPAGRKPKPAGAHLSAILACKVTRDTATAFVRLAGDRNMSKSDMLRMLVEEAVAPQQGDRQ